MQSCTKVDGSKGSETSTTLTGFNKGPVQNCDGPLSFMQASDTLALWAVITHSHAPARLYLFNNKVYMHSMHTVVPLKIYAYSAFIAVLD